MSMGGERQATPLAEWEKALLADDTLRRAEAAEAESAELRVRAEKAEAERDEQKRRLGAAIESAEAYRRIAGRLRDGIQALANAWERRPYVKDSEDLLLTALRGLLSPTPEPEGTP